MWKKLVWILILILILIWLILRLRSCGGGRVEPEPTGKLVFVSSQTYDGNFGAGQRVLGHELADGLCQGLAEQAGLAGTFKAWVSGRVDTGAGPLPHGVVDRFAPATEPYKLVDGTVVADDWADLTDGSLDHPIGLTETGGSVGAETRVWTNTTTDGKAWTNSTHCAVGPNPDIAGLWTWTCGPPSWSPGDCQFQSGKYGDAHATSGSWTGTAASNTACSAELHIYCFEQ